MIKKFFKKANFNFYDDYSLEKKVLSQFTLFFIPFGLLFIIARISFFLYYNVYEFPNLTNFILIAIAFLFVLLIFLRIVISYVIKKVVIERIDVVSKEMLNIKNEEHNKKRFDVSGTDEIDKLMYLANSIFDKYDNMIELEKKHSLIDPLTLALNRRALNLNFAGLRDKANRMNKTISLLLFDIDDFKKFNDNYGHDVGDEVLRKISIIVKSLIRKYDSFYRVGGEEFIVLFYDLKKSEIDTILKRIKTQITYQLNKNCHKIETNVTVSGGFVSSKKFDLNEDKVLLKMMKAADELLYNAKEKGKNRIMHNS